MKNDIKIFIAVSVFIITMFLMIFVAAIVKNTKCSDLTIDHKMLIFTNGYYKGILNHVESKSAKDQYSIFKKDSIEFQNFLLKR